jgi:hypothetical protein
MHINSILKIENIYREGNTFVSIPKPNGSKHLETYAFVTIQLKFYSSSNIIVNSKTEF